MANHSLSIENSDAERFYRSAVLGLCALDSREGSGRRLGPDADARWRAFRGALRDSDRIDWLLRDAAATQPLGFAPRALFRLAGLTQDEPFGRSWAGLHEPLAIELLSQATRHAPSSLTALLQSVIAIWGLSPQLLPAGSVDHLRAASRVVIAGAGAVLAVLPQFAERRDFDLADQVLLVADGAGVRQLFGLGAAWLATNRSPRCLGSQDLAAGLAASTVRAAGFDRLDEAILSDDATDAERAAVARLMAERVG